MNWISGLSQVFFAVLLTGLTGNIMLVIWFLCRILFEKRNPKFVYYMLKWVVIMYLLPIAYIGFAMHYDTGYVKPMSGLLKMLFVMDTNNLQYKLLMLLWFVMTSVMIGFCVKNLIGRWRMSKCNFEDGASLAQTEFERIREQLGISEKVILLRNDYPKLYSPFVTGIFRKKVILPYRDYTKQELHAILYHELNHIKKNDVIFRYLTMCAVILNSINPISFLIWNQILMWSEAACDASALDALEHEDIHKREYYDIIWKLMSSEPYELRLFYHPMLSNTAKSLYRRMEIMERYRANTKKAAKAVAVAWVMVVAMLSTVTAHAAGSELAELGDERLKESQIVGQYGDFDDYGTWSEEMLVPASDIVKTIYINDDIMTLGAGTIDWDVPVGTRCVSGSIYMSAGTVVSIACTGRPSNCTYWFGLMYASSECAVVEGSGSGAHDFTVPSNGYYRIMVENRSSSAMHVTGGYQY